MVAKAKEFVCAADEVWRLQRGSDADCVFFQRMVTGGKRITDRGSRQGTWICAPGGVVLARSNTRSIDAVLETLERGLAAWDELPEEAKRVPADAELVPAHRWEHAYPADGLVLERVARDLSLEGPAGERGARWNLDHAWFSRDELAALVPDDATPGDELDLAFVARRLARFHLVDNVRGQTIPYADEEVEGELRARVVGRAGPRVELVLSGETRALAEGPWLLGHNLWKPNREDPHGLESRIAGRATWDVEARRFGAFELAVAGRRWGRTVMNGRRGDAGSSLVGFHLRIAPSERRVAPTFVALYDVDWIPKPEVPTWLESPAECGLEGEK